MNVIVTIICTDRVVKRLSTKLPVNCIMTAGPGGMLMSWMKCKWHCRLLWPTDITFIPQVRGLFPGAINL